MFSHFSGFLIKLNFHVLELLWLTQLSLACKTGSGKTYTMGTNYTGEESSGGIIPKVMESIFSRVEAMKDSTEFLIRVSFIEVT